MDPAPRRSLLGIGAFLGGLSVATVGVIPLVRAALRREVFQPPRPAASMLVPAGFEVLPAVASGAPVMFARPQPGRPLVIFFHGNATDVASSTEQFLPLHSAGLGVAAIEYPGYGGTSAPHPSRQRVIDGCARTLESLLAQGEFDEVILLGHSLGSAIAIALAERGFGDRLIVAAGFPSSVDVAQHLAPWIPGRVLEVAFGNEQFDNIALARRVTVPTLVAHGTADRTLPFDGGQRLAAAFPRGHFISLTGADHTLAGDWLTLADLATQDPAQWPSELTSQAAANQASGSSAGR